MKNFPLKLSVFILLGNHILQMLFMRDFYDEHGRVNTNHKWVWVIHAISYAYVLYVYIFTDARNVDMS